MKVSKNKLKCLNHRSYIKQRLRKSATTNIPRMGIIPAMSMSKLSLHERIFYSLWCAECDHHIVTISHEDAWNAKRKGMPIEHQYPVESYLDKRSRIWDDNESIRQAREEDLAEQRELDAMENARGNDRPYYG